MDNKEFLEKLLSMNVNKLTENLQVGGKEYTYLSWCYAWRELLKIDETANFKVKMFPQADGTTAPYIASLMGFMVFTEITANGITRECFLPVLDGANKPLKYEPYTYTGWGFVNGKKTQVEKSVSACTMFDINKTIMRCLAKNIAMFGLGLYIYAGEDLPETTKDTLSDTELKLEQIKKIYTGENLKKLLDANNITSIEELSETKINELYELLLKRNKEK